jgi:CubicO group peptidase (beta-lactamase class C family)
MRRIGSVIVVMAFTACQTGSVPRQVLGGGSPSPTPAPRSSPAAAPPPTTKDVVIRPGLGRAIADSLVALAGAGCPGTILVAVHDTIVLRQGFGVIRGEPVFAEGTDSRHWIASVTMQFAAAAILRLQETGRLSVMAPIGTVFTGVPQDKRGITIHQLLTHTSGLPDAYTADSVRDRAEAVRRILALKLDHAPGATFHLSDDNYVLIAAIIEIASGMTYEEYLRTQLFEPAGMQASGFWGSVAAPFIAPISRPVPPEQVGEQWGQRGAGGVFSTTGDLFRWIAAVQHGKLLTESSRSRLFGQYATTAAGTYGYGWVTSTTPWKTPLISTRGRDEWGPNALIALYPQEGLTVIALSHALTTDDRPCTRLAESIVEHFYTPGR